MFDVDGFKFKGPYIKPQTSNLKQKKGPRLIAEAFVQQSLSMCV